MPVKRAKRNTVLYALISVASKKKLTKLAKSYGMSISEYIEQIITEIK